MARTKESSKDVVQGQAEEDNVLRAQVDFYAELRDHLAVNEASSGLQAVDALALALIADDDSLPATLTEVVTLLPPPGSIEDGQPPTHALLARHDHQAPSPAQQGPVEASGQEATHHRELPEVFPRAPRRRAGRDPS
ncbi:hypothetical protein PInf_023480 [Phytophthora infestans]|nr:hypothetical protein PInf_023480 [Phytophthora infestans]